MLAQHIAQRDAILSTKGMIGDKGAKPSVVGQVLQPPHVKVGIEKFHASLQELYANLTLRTNKEFIELILMDDALEVGDHKSRHILRLRRGLFTENPVYVNQE